MTQEEFDKLSEKFLTENCTPEEVALLRKWADLHYEEQSRAEIFDTENEENLLEEKLWTSVQSVLPGSRWIRWGKITVGVAASLLIGSLVLFSLPQNRNKIENREVAVEKTSHSTSSRVTLPDGSVVILEEGADIVTDQDFGDTDRKVRLTGEAFFEVKPDRKRPFIVISGDLVTEVLGTSFRIKPESKLNKIEVSVHTGKVSVYTAQTKGKKNRDGVIATPNQKVSYDVASGMLMQNLVDTPIPIQQISKEKELLYDEVPVSDVLNGISELYGIQIISGNPTINRCIFTGDLNGLDLYKQIDAVCQVVGLEYEVRGTSIFISGKGCL